MVSGRYHRAPGEFPNDEVWAALYLALSPEVGLGEVLRHFDDLMPQLNEYRLSELAVEISVVFDCRNAASLGLTMAGLIRDGDFLLTQELAAEAITRGAEAILVPSATKLGDNLIVFPERLTAASTVTFIGSRDPRLYVRR